MSTFALKLIAIITMLIDHIGVVFVPTNTVQYLVMRSIGRLAFPIFIFLIVEGFYHTRDVKKYILRLGIFALVSEIPFDMAFNSKILEGSHQNVFFTLFLGLVLITLMTMVEKKFVKQIILINLLNGLLTIGFCVLAFILRTDYNYAGILMMTVFFLFRGSKPLLLISLFSIAEFILGSINVLATLAIIPIFFYNGKKGKDVKFIFYIFYPAHLLILALVSTLL